jgi:hypothetical protein
MLAWALSLAVLFPQALGDAPRQGVTLLAETDAAAQRAARLIELDRQIAASPLAGHCRPRSQPPSGRLSWA